MSYRIQATIQGNAVPNRVVIYSPDRTSAPLEVALIRGTLRTTVEKEGTYTIGVRQFNNFARPIGQITVPQEAHAILKSDKELIEVRVDSLPDEWNISGRVYLIGDDRSNFQGSTVDSLKSFTLDLTDVPNLFRDSYRNILLQTEDASHALSWSISLKPPQRVSLSFHDAVSCAPVGVNSRSAPDGAEANNR